MVTRCCLAIVLVECVVIVVVRVWGRLRGTRWTLIDCLRSGLLFSYNLTDLVDEISACPMQWLIRLALMVPSMSRGHAVVLSLGSCGGTG